jgi:hypothetical protein
MRRKKNISGRKKKQGVIITLVAVFMLFVIGAMAALSIDVVTLYTARSEAQLAADAGALAGARALANSGVTSDPRRRLIRNAKTLAVDIATQMASQNVVGGRPLNPGASAGEVTVSFPNETDPAFDTNPHVTVQTRRTDLPTFFARIWGKTQITVAASATAEAYNPSGANALGETTLPVAPICVKPWLLPNIDPTQVSATGPAIFDVTSGAIVATRGNSLSGQSWGTTTRRGNPTGLSAACSDCSATIPPPAPGQYYPGAIDATDFPVPPQPSSGCGAKFNSNPYQLAVALCVQQPISCGAQTISIDPTAYGTTRDADTVAAASCLIHYNGAAGDSDSIDPTTSLPPFQFIAGNQNPIPRAIGKDVLVSDSLVTIPVIDVTTPPTLGNPVTIIGFLQGFLNPSSDVLPAGQIPVTIVNLVGCGTGSAGIQPILGNGASPVAVRLIAP